MIKYWWFFIWAHVLAHMYWNFNLSFPINLLLHTEQQNSYSLRNSRYILALFLSILEILILNNLVGFSFCMTKFPESYSDLFSFFSFLKGFHWSTVLQINVFRMTGDFFIQAYQRWSWAGGLGPQWGSRKKTQVNYWNNQDFTLFCCKSGAVGFKKQNLITLHWLTCQNFN